MKASETPKVLVITGPTAAGKTALGVLLAEEMGGEVVSADSMQVYRRMDIGTAKPGAAEMRGIPHHMLDVAEPEEGYSAARYVDEADVCLRDILSRGKLPVIVGGTGLYIDSLISGRTFAAPAADPELRRELSERYDSTGGETMLAELFAADPERAGKLHPSDKKRILRALEIYYTTGRTISEHDEETRAKPPRYEAAVIALDFRNREDLYARIDRRVDRMFASGLAEEVRELLDSGLAPGCTAMQAIGYKETALALRGEIGMDEAAELVKRESRRYAKRQLTWLRRKEGLCRIIFEKEPDFDFARRLSTEFLKAQGLK